MAPARSGGWIALEETLFALAGPAPAIAAQLRAELTPPSGPDLAGTLILAIGAEGPGLSPDLLARAALHLTIPMEPGVESLNATVAAALVLFELRRRRGGMA